MGGPSATRPRRHTAESLQITIRAQNVEVTAAQRVYIERRVALSLSRFGEKIGRVTVDCSDVGDASGGKGKRCQIEVALPRAVRVQDTDPDLARAVRRATDRALRSVARALALDSGV